MKKLTDFTIMGSWFVRHLTTIIIHFTDGKTEAKTNAMNKAGPNKALVKP